MLLSHAVLLAEARTYVAARAEQAAGFDAALEYERVLLPSQRRADRLYTAQL